MMQETENNRPKRGRPKLSEPRPPKPPKQDRTGPPLKPEAEKILATRVTIKKGELDRDFQGKIELYQDWLHAQYLQFCSQQNQPENEQHQPH